MAKAKFIGRQNELQQLNDLLHKKTASLVVVKGRRRIGKTRLIEEFAKNKSLLRFVGLAPEEGVTAQVQRDEFSRLLSEQTGLPEINTSDWSKLFSLLGEKVKTGRQVILMDEISWMAHDDSTFLSKLKNAWELYYKQNPQLILILCGSISAWIERNILSSTGYFGRISLKITLKELSVQCCNELLGTLGFKRSSHEKLEFLSLTGGIPWYIEQVNAAYSSQENIKRLCFAPDGLLVDEYKYIFHDLFGRRNKIYEKITMYLASKPAEFSQIAQGISYANSGTLSEYLDELISAGYINKTNAWSLRSKLESTISIYRLSDNYLRFYYKYILPKLNLIEQGQLLTTHLMSLPNWSGMMGLQFESVVLKNRASIHRALRIPGEEIVAANPYYQRATKRVKGCQIDYLIQTRSNTLYVCEIKFSKNEIKKTVIKEMQEKINAIDTPRNYACVPVLIHVNGVVAELEESEFLYKIIDFSQLLTDVP